MSYIISGPLNLPMLIIQKFLRSFEILLSSSRAKTFNFHRFIDSRLSNIQLFERRGRERVAPRQKMFNKSSADGRLIRKKSGTAPRAALVIYVNAAEVGEPGPVIIVFSRM